MDYTQHLNCITQNCCFVFCYAILIPVKGICCDVAKWNKKEIVYVRKKKNCSINCYHFEYFHIFNMDLLGGKWLCTVGGVNASLNCVIGTSPPPDTNDLIKLYCLIVQFE
uniref:Uncharacterized protein n=1 Tax=Strigamia maritima TaxID=126957 RepID=T1IKH7_STRMM